MYWRFQKTEINWKQNRTSRELENLQCEECTQTIKEVVSNLLCELYFTNLFVHNHRNICVILKQQSTRRYTTFAQDWLFSYMLVVPKINSRSFPELSLTCLPMSSEQPSRISFQMLLCNFIMTHKDE